MIMEFVGEKELVKGVHSFRHFLLFGKEQPPPPYFATDCPQSETIGVQSGDLVWGR